MTRTTKTALLLALAALSAQAQQYTKKGELLFLKDYRHWDFISASVAMNYPEDEGPGGHPMFGNLFVQPSARQQFEKTGTWPDKTVLLMELRGVGKNDPAVSHDSFLSPAAEFQAELMGYEAHVKDSSRGGWAFYMFSKDSPAGRPLPKTANCFTCHANHGAVDTTFVQYYPILIPAAKQHGTFHEAH